LKEQEVEEITPLCLDLRSHLLERLQKEMYCPGGLGILDQKPPRQPATENIEKRENGDKPSPEQMNE
jgi:hypothetical protein